MRRVTLPEAILEERVVPVARGMTPESAPGMAVALRQGGITVIEITVEGTDGIDAIGSLRGSELTTGAGTITSIGLAAAAVEAGASFLVSPHFDPELTGWALDRGVPMFPGAFTPTEVFAAWESGAPAVKVFPASVGGTRSDQGDLGSVSRDWAHPDRRDHCRQCRRLPGGRRRCSRCGRVADRRRR